ncbi:MAG: hypothetical protein COX70_03395, partial [Flavobacteriales bacterium CG_4_10_14_0_2_um_filter_32_8]
IFLFCTLLFFCFFAQAQAQDYGYINGVELANMPMPISNNAVVGVWANDTAYVFSFGGIDSTKIWSGITLKSFRYNTTTDLWDTILPLPDTLGKIASAASYVDSIIYIIGGYHILSNGNEISSNKVHRYQPSTNSYLSDGVNLPIPVDDQVQVVWNDSLIYIITGWSNTGNIPDVQIYDPANDNWLVGTPVPNNNTYKAFGASGLIIGNTIYYHGGASTGINFPGQNTLRIGQINPLNPSQITWSSQSTSYVSYRAAAIYDYWMNKPVFVGGSEITYNYDGIAYNGSGGVPPKGFSLGFDAYSPNDLGPTFQQYVGFDTILPIDLRGIAFPFSYGNYIAGGMLYNQEVSNKTYKIFYDHAESVNELTNDNLFKLFPNPVTNQLTIVFKEIEKRTIRLIDVLGKKVLEDKNSDVTIKVNVSQFSKGIYLLKVETDKENSSQKIIIQ